LRKLAHIAPIVVLLIAAGCGCGEGENAPRKLRIFHAGGLAPLLESVRDDVLRDLNIELVTESTGSQTACRKVAELGRQCDLLMLADNSLIASLLSDHCSWRIDFANDEMVIGVGMRAPDVAQAEENWVPILLKPNVRIARVDESLGPIGYRTLMTWQLKEKQGAPGLAEKLTKKCEKVVDHVARLSPLLKMGEVDYAFIYRSLCVAHDIRFIDLAPSINLGHGDMDYSGASVSFAKSRTGESRKIVVQGTPIIWTLTVPREGSDSDTAVRFIQYLFQKNDVFKKHGFRLMESAVFHGELSAFAQYESCAKYGGAME
jgi:molybdate/tungstate transport system substrate-binding protein